MDQKEEALINAVKVAVSSHGISGISTRIIGDVAGVNDAYIYRYFKNKEELLLRAYMKENGDFFKVILQEVKKVHDLPYSFEEKARISFEKSWDSVISDKERLIFCVCYYHSIHFNHANEYHNEQIKELYNNLGCYFDNYEDCLHAMYSMCSILYDSAYTVLTGRAENTPDYIHRVFITEFAILTSFMGKNNAHTQI